MQTIKILAAAAIFGTAALTTVPATADVQSNGISLNGISLNGISLNAEAFNGRFVQGQKLNHRSHQGPTVSDVDGGTLGTIAVERGRLVIRTAK